MRSLALVLAGRMRVASAIGKRRMAHRIFPLIFMIGVGVGTAFAQMGFLTITCIVGAMHQSVRVFEVCNESPPSVAVERHARLMIALVAMYRRFDPERLEEHLGLFVFRTRPSPSLRPGACQPSDMESAIGWLGHLASLQGAALTEEIERNAAAIQDPNGGSCF